MKHPVCGKEERNLEHEGNRALEDGKVSLDDSLKLYEEGIALVRLCSGRLDEAEQKIKIIRTSSDGSKTEEDFAG